MVRRVAFRAREGGRGKRAPRERMPADPRRISAVRERAASRQLIIAGVAFVRKRVPERPSAQEHNSRSDRMKK